MKQTRDSNGQYKTKQSGRRKLLIAICIFASVFFTSTAYAMSNGFFYMQGTVARTENLDARFINARFTDSPRIGEYAAISALDGQRSFSVSAQLLMPGDFREVAFQIRNTGNQAVRLLNLQYVADNPATTGLIIIWPDDNPNSPSLTNYVLVPGVTSDTFFMQIGWDPNLPGVPTGLFNTFSLTLDFQNALLPIGSP